MAVIFQILQTALLLTLFFAKTQGYPEITSSYLNNTVVYTNEAVKCQAKGSPTPYVAWVRSGVVLVNKTSTAEITITEDNGEYVCVASNQEGAAKITVKAKASLQACNDSCIISDVSRAVFHIYHSTKVNNYRGHIDLSKWYRIQSPAGNQLPTTCVPHNSCGTQAPGWLNGAHPSIQDGIVKRTFCFNLNGDCCYQNTTVHIRECSGYYVYKFSAFTKVSRGLYRIGSKDHRSSMFQASDGVPGSSLIGHVIHAETDVHDVFACMKHCLVYSDCKSFNFSREKKMCEVNNAVRCEDPDALTENSSFVYYEKVSAIM